MHPLPSDDCRHDTRAALAHRLQAVRAWADEILQLSPTSLKVLKQSFNADTEQFASLGQMAYSNLKLFGDTPEAKEGVTAFNEKRSPDFAPYRGN